MNRDDPVQRQPWTILRTLQWTARYFTEKGIEQPRPAAEILLAHVLSCQRIDLYMHHDQPLSQQELDRFRRLIQRRVNREPVAYIVGSKEFWSLTFEVNPDVLIPRPETERLVELVLAQFGAQTRLDVLDLGTGSGVIGIALSVERPDWWIRAMDASPKALVVARKNARSNGRGDHIRFFAGDWFAPLSRQKARFDLIVSNPPYIPSADIPGLETEVMQYEPLHALDGGPQGADDLAHLIQNSPAYLKKGGHLFLEIGYDQGPAVAALAKASGAYREILIHKDYGQRDRVVQLVKA